MPPVYIMDCVHDCGACRNRVSEVLKVVTFRRLNTAEKLLSIQLTVSIFHGVLKTNRNGKTPPIQQYIKLMNMVLQYTLNSGNMDASKTEEIRVCGIPSMIFRQAR